GHSSALGTAPARPRSVPRRARFREALLRAVSGRAGALQSRVPRAEVLLHAPLVAAVPHLVAGGRDQGAHALTLYQEPGLSGLELWRGISRGATLFQLRERKREYFEGLRGFLVRLHRGEAESSDANETAELRRAAGFARVVLCGGEAAHPELAPVLETGALPFTIEIDTTGPYVARRGALRIFRAMQWQRGAALDLGQLQLKLITESQLLLLPRDDRQLPFGPYALDAALGRARLRQWISG